MRRLLRILLAIVDRIFPRRYVPRYDIGDAYHAACVRREAMRAEDRDVSAESLRRQQAIRDRILTGYSRTKARRLDRFELTAKTRLRRIR